MKNYLIDHQNESERLNFQNKIDTCNIDEEISHFQWNTEHRILDAGCGNGNVIEKLAERKMQFIDGIDFSLNRIEDAKKRFSHLKNVNLYQASLEETHLESATYDTIICRYIFEHVTNPKLILGELNRVLKPNGIINIVNFDDMVFNFYTKNEDFNRELKRVKNQIPQDLEIGRKIPQYLKQNNFDRVTWQAQTYFFQGERLELEKKNAEMRFLQARDHLGQYFDSLSDYDTFVKNYLSEMNDDCNVLSTTKYLITARKKYLNCV